MVGHDRRMSYFIATLIAFAPSGFYGSNNATRRLSTAVRILVLTVPTGNSSISAIWSYVKLPFWRSRKISRCGSGKCEICSRSAVNCRFRSASASTSIELVSCAAISSPNGFLRRRHACRLVSLAVLMTTRKIQARKLRTLPACPMLFQHLMNASWKASAASSALPNMYSNVPYISPPFCA